VLSKAEILAGGSLQGNTSSVEGVEGGSWQILVHRGNEGKGDETRRGKVKENRYLTLALLINVRSLKATPRRETGHRPIARGTRLGRGKVRLPILSRFNDQAMGRGIPRQLVKKEVQEASDEGEWAIYLQNLPNHGYCTWLYRWVARTMF